MNFKTLAEYLEQLSQTSSRLEITKILASLYKAITPLEARYATYLLTGSLAPTYEGVIFNIAQNTMMAIIARAYDHDIEAVKQLYKKKGDLGTVAAELSKNKDDDLTITAVYEALREVSSLSGEGSIEGKVVSLATLLAKLDAVSAKYVVRIPIGNLRLGFSDKTILDALSVMERGDKSGKKNLEFAYQVLPDVGLLAEKVKKHGIEKATTQVMPVVGVPVMPMLAQRLKSPAEMIKKMGEVAIEPKFDGLRVLIHYSKPKGILKAFTRNLHDISPMFPELSEIGKHITADEIILDSEAVGVDTESLKMADFQTTMQRRRKNDISEMQNKIPVTFQVFDMLFCDNKNFMDVPYLERRKELTNVVKNGSLLKVDEYTVTTDPEIIRSKHAAYREEGLEGVIVKSISGTYVPGRTGWRWVKMKEAEEAVGKLSDTVDGVVMGYSVGRGKRVDFGVGQFLVGVVDGDQIKTVTKVGTGLSDDQFRELSKRLSAIKVAEMPQNYEVHKNLIPDFWVKPSLVVELAADDLTVSPNHMAGYALRFPRLVKFRDDKSPKQATTVAEIKKLFDLQKK